MVASVGAAVGVVLDVTPEGKAEKLATEGVEKLATKAEAQVAHAMESKAASVEKRVEGVLADADGKVSRVAPAKEAKAAESGAARAAESGAGKDFDQARREAFDKAGMTDPTKVEFTKVDPKTGTVVEFKGPDGAKVAYDGPHATPGPGHESPHVGYQTGGKRSAGGAERGNIPYTGPQHPSRSPIKGEGVVDPH